MEWALLMPSKVQQKSPMLHFKSVRNPCQMAIVALLHFKTGIEGGSGARVNGESHRCAQCGRGGAGVGGYYGEASAWLHRGGCRDAWMAVCERRDRAIPPPLGRRGEGAARG